MAKACEIRRLRRLTCETDIENSPYSDTELNKYIDRADGNIYWAAAEICQEKAAAVNSMYDFSADGGTYHRGDLAAKWLKLADRYSALGGKRSGGTIELIKWPPEKQVRNVLAE